MHQKTFWDQNKLLEIFWSSNFFARKLEIWHKIGNLIHKTCSAFTKSSALPRAMGYCPGFIWSLNHLDLGRTIQWQLINQLRPGFCPCGYFTDIHLIIYSYRVFIWRFPISVPFGTHLPQAAAELRHRPETWRSLPHTSTEVQQGSAILIPHLCRKSTPKQKISV